MPYKIIHFTPVTSNNENITGIVQQFQSIIEANALDGWQYLRLETIYLPVRTDSSPFAVGGAERHPASVNIRGAVPNGIQVTLQVLVFSKDE